MAGTHSLQLVCWDNWFSNSFKDEEWEWRETRRRRGVEGTGDDSYRVSVNVCTGTSECVCGSKNEVTRMLSFVMEWRSVSMEARALAVIKLLCSAPVGEINFSSRACPPHVCPPSSLSSRLRARWLNFVLLLAELLTQITEHPGQQRHGLNEMH